MTHRDGPLLERARAAATAGTTLVVDPHEVLALAVVAAAAEDLTDALDGHDHHPLFGDARDRADDLTDALHTLRKARQ